MPQLIPLDTHWPDLYGQECTLGTIQVGGKTLLVLGVIRGLDPQQEEPDGLKRTADLMYLGPTRTLWLGRRFREFRDSGTFPPHPHYEGGEMYPFSHFLDDHGKSCTVQKSSDERKAAIWLGVGENRMILDRVLVAELIPYLQNYIDKGSLQ